ncbi:MAG: choice-of-anchor L domain-containing protein [Bacteroidota bacterium]
MRLFTPAKFLFWCLALVATQPLVAQGITGNEPIILDGHDQRHSLVPLSEHQAVTFQNLIVNQTYNLVVPSDPTLDGCIPDVTSTDPGVQILGYNQAARQLRFVANATEMHFRLDYYCSWNAASPPSHYISLFCESCVKKSLKQFIAETGPIEVAGGQTAEDLVREVLIGGNCFDITNVTYDGQGGQIGSFSNGLTNVGFATGLIMATGDISVAVGPNDQDNASAGYGIATGDGDLSTLTGGSIFDRAGIEFDFTPTQSPLTFEFVFASEEYCEYVNSAFNDVFGFFISGPGIAGTQNIALIPSTTIPVSINTVNHLTNAGFYINNTPASGSLCGQTASALPSVNELQFDGYTRRMVATANVQTCKTYHIKLKIGDVGDGIFDSAVFLKNGSFDAGGNASVDFVVNGDPDIDEVYEGCGTVQLIFDRVGGNINVPISVPYTITGTATKNLDYSGIPNVAVIPAGQDKLILTVNINNDGIVEGDETVIITLNNPCSCSMPQEILTIHDLPQLMATPDTVTICGPGAGTVSVTPVTGVPPFTYHWQTGSSEQTITQFANISTNYKVTVTDACGKTFVATARIIVTAPPIAQLLPPAPQLCPGQDGIIKVNFTGIPPYSLEYTINGNAQPPITEIHDDPYNLVINQPGLYQITAVYDSNGCKGNGQGALLVTVSTLTTTGVVSNVKCFGQSNGSINTTTTGGQSPFTFTWTGPTPIGNIADPINIKAGTYTVTVTDFFGCQNTNTFVVAEPPAIAPAFVNIIGPNCYNPNGGSIDLSVSGGTPNYSYKWNNGALIQDPQNLGVGTYTVTITDMAGCVKTATATVAGNFTPPIADAVVSGNITCSAPTLVIDGSASSSGPGITYSWSANPGTIVSGGTTTNPTVSLAGTYTILVTNTSNGCTATDPAIVTSDVALPTANAGPNQTLTCAITNISLNGSGSSTGGNFTYQWSAGPGGNIIGGSTTLNPIISTTGLYTLVVTNQTNGCTKSDDAAVNSNTVPPTAVIANPPLLTCQNTSVTLNGGNSTPTGTLTYQWSTTNGLILSGQGSANAVAGEPGLYTLVVTNTVNGCTDTKNVTVNQDNSVPTANAAVTTGLDCNTTQLTISGNGSSTGANYTFQWTSSPGGNFVSGQNSLNPVVNKPATYTLLVTNATSQCTASASVLVSQDIQAPVANPGAPGTLTCATLSLLLGDTNAIIAPNLSYNWTGTGITAGGNTPTPTINQPGTFQLVVLNSTNGCSSTASITIPQNITKPTAVVSQPGQLNCTTPALQLNGNGSSSGPNFTYDWTSSSGGGIGAGGTTLTPTVTAAGTYTLLITNIANGCTSTVSATVTSNANLPTAVAAPSGIITCAVQQITLNATGSSSGPNYTYNWGTINGQISGGQGTIQATATKAGQYTLLVTNTTNNCTATFNVDVDADLAPPVANAGQAQTLDCTQPSLTLDGSASSTGANFTYKWSSLSGTGILSANNILNPQVNEPGTYQLVVTNTQNGCTSASNVLIQGDANDPVVLIAAPAILNCVTQQVNLNGNGSSTGSNISYSWNGQSIVSGNNSLNAVVDKPGDYTLLITNTNNGCTSEQTVTVNQDIIAPPVDAGPDAVLNCYNPQLQIGGPNNPTGPNYTFHWTGTGIVSGVNNATAVIGQGGNYDLLVTNTVNGCTSTESVTIATDFVQPQANAGPGFQLTCVINSYTLQATASQGPNFKYQWTTNTGSFIDPVNILNPKVNGSGDYYLQVTNTDNGCTQTSSVQITQAADVPVAVAADAATLTCAVTSIPLDGVGSSTGSNFSYLWTASNGGNIVSGANTLNPMINAPGDYNLAVTNTTNNCVSNSSVTVGQDIALPVIDAGISPTLTCANPVVGLSGTVSTNGNFTYQWQGPNIVNGGTTLTPNVGAGGTYNLTVTNQQNGCSSTDNVLVNVDQTPPQPVIQTPGILTCVVQQVTLNATSSTTGNMQYTWTVGNNGHIVDQSTPLQPIVDKPGTYTLMIRNNDNGCTQSATSTVTQNIVHPVSNAGSDNLLTCAVTSLQLNGNGSSQNGNYFYQWTTTGTGQILVGANSLTPTVIAGGTYSLVVINNDNGCTATDEAVVNVNTQPPAALVAAPGIITCTQPQIVLDGSQSQGGANISYGWTTSTGNIVSGQNSNKATVNSAGTYILTVLNNTTGCSTDVTAVVSDNIILPIADAGAPFTLTCTVNQVTLQGTGSNGAIFTYNWTAASGGQIVSGANTLNPVVNKSGIYTLLVTNTSTGCKKEDQVEVLRETNVPTGFITNLKPPSCKDNDGIITFKQVNGGYGPYMYSINNGQTFLPEIDFANIVPGTYDLWIQDVNGCEFHQPLLVPKAPDPAVSITPEFNIVLGDSIQLEAVLPSGYPLSLIDTVIWTPITGLHFNGTDIFSLLNPGAKPFKPTEYVVTIVSNDGCNASDRVLIRVDNEPHIYIPNVFTPSENDNNNNSIFYIFADGDQVLSIDKFQIFDRWGELVFQDHNFQPNDPSHGWDGRLGGKMQTPAVFVYYAEIKLIDGRTILYKGDVTLVR